MGNSAFYGQICIICNFFVQTDCPRSCINNKHALLSLVLGCLAKSCIMEGNIHVFNHIQGSHFSGDTKLHVFYRLFPGEIMKSQVNLALNHCLCC